jgi:hypothetical protein
LKFAGWVAAIVLVAVLGAVVPAADARMAKLKGQVVGQPYAAKKGTVVPVLLVPKSAKRARLVSCVGALKVSAKRVRAARGQRIATTRLRIGDVVQTRTRVSRAARRPGYWRIRTRKLNVTKRSGTLSPAELEELIAGLRGDLTRLTQAVVDLAAYTTSRFGAVDADIASLRSDLNALRAEFTALAAQVSAVSAQLTALEASLQAQIDALTGELAGFEAQLQDVVDDIAALNAAVASLGTQLATLQGQVTTLTTNLAALSATVSALSGQLGDLSNLGGTVEALLTGVAPGDIADALSNIGTLHTDLAALQGIVGGSGSGLVLQVNALSTVVGSAGTGLVGAVSDIQAADVATAADVAELETSVAAAEGRLDDLEMLVSAPGGIAADVAALETVVGSASSGLVQQVNDIQSDVNILCGPSSPLNALC